MCFLSTKQYCALKLYLFEHMVWAHFPGNLCNSTLKSTDNSKVVILTCVTNFTLSIVNFKKKCTADVFAYLI